MNKGKGWEVKTVTDNFSKHSKALDFIKNNAVYVGVQQKESSREDEEITNAELLFIHTKGAKVKKRKSKNAANDLFIFSNGSPYFNIPARPVIEPALKENSKQLSSIMKKAAQCAMDGNFAEALKQLNIAGTRGRDVSKLWFTNPKNHWAKNAPSVVVRKEKKGSTDPKPLIDTGELRNSISYFVKTKGGQKK